ncbi:MAG TPA: PhzF family phenazine biosynthesis protein [Solirubrobacteraceae bacterium]|jgi:trans-2,3-dihydro-3-hydroxyanthranilate isomerase|nr:PhzF family phenazine biosynthesis protein [Solirubrobacteraceae bacterium]
MPLPYVIADAFTDRPLEGNGVAVFTRGEGLDDSTMQRLARETNLSETVFVSPARRGGDAAVRIFTPTAELPFAGHPVLGTAFVLASAEQDEITLETRAGDVPLALEREQSGRLTFARMAQPLPTTDAFDQEAALLAALGVSRSELPIGAYTNGPHTRYVALESAEAVSALAPDMQGLAAIGANICCFADAGSYWRVRVFCPYLGVPEDPATGSAAGPFSLNLARNGVIDFGTEVEIHQGDEIGRPSILRSRTIGSMESIERIEVGGCAVIVARGEFDLGDG